ncbi:MAG TPA: AraC family ligand binding domain-containing protein, partial [Polyangiaceae bacterium]|nr:AraC family ligand binding domain-containing protein [Polyangiaceae bacterium]
MSPVDSAAEDLGLHRLGFRERVFLANRIVPLHAMITSTGYVRQTSPSYDWHGIKRGSAEFVLLQHTLSGAGRLEFEGKTFEVLPGMTMLLHFPHDNRYFLPPGQQWEFFYLCLKGQEVV